MKMWQSGIESMWKITKMNVENKCATPLGQHTHNKLLCHFIITLSAKITTPPLNLIPNFDIFAIILFQVQKEHLYIKSLK